MVVTRPMEYGDLYLGADAQNLKFVNISSEQWREYDFGEDGVVRIDSPLALNVSRSGGHRVWDADGVSHYVPKGWIHLRWLVKPDNPHFVA